MAYIGDTFGGISVQVETSGLDVVRIDGHDVTFEDAKALADFVSNEVYRVRKERGDFERW